MKDADNLGIFDASKQAAEADVYKEALQRIEAEVAKVPNKEPEESKGPAKVATAEEEEQQALEKFGDDLMSNMMQDESNYIAEYNDVISSISKVCSHI